MDWFGNEAKNREFDKYVRELPEGDQDILRQYFIQVYTRYILEVYVEDPVRILQNIIRIMIEGLTEKRCLKIARIIHKAIEFSGTITVHVTVSEITHSAPDVPSDSAPDNSTLDYRSADEHKTEGNLFFKSNKYKEAILCYSRAIAIDANNPVYYSNRAISYLKLESFEDALLDAEKAVSIDPQTSKYRMRLALAWAGLDNHEKCCEILEKLSDVNNDTIIEKEWRFVCNSRGEFDFKEMETQVGRREEVKIADFIGPVSIRYNGDRGYALFAGRDIKKGETILVSKAIAFSYSLPTVMRQDVNQPASVRGDGKKLKLLNSLSSNAEQSTLSSHRLFYLYPRVGTTDPVPIELYRSGGYELVRGRGKFPHTTADVKHVISYKSYPVVNEPAVAARATKRQEERGVWYVPSFINHSCLPSVHQRFIGDISIIQANTELKVNQEITLSYIYVYKYDGVDERKRELRERWGFNCMCELCEFESDPANRDKIARSFQLRDVTQKLCSLSSNPLQIIAPAQYRLLADAVELARELQLSHKMFSASLWQAILALTKLRIAPNDCSVYFEFIDKIKPYLCELELVHQLGLWNNCLSYFHYIQLHEKDKRREDVHLRCQEVKSRFYNIVYE